MAPMMMPAAHAIADLLAGSSTEAVRVLDVAAGHGMFGITVAQRNPRAEITAVDWAPVLTVQLRKTRGTLVFTSGTARCPAMPSRWISALATMSPW